MKDDEQYNKEGNENSIPYTQKALLLSMTSNWQLAHHTFCETVVQYLVEHGIEADRLTPMGYGKEKPKTIRKKLTEKYPFLKENDVLTEEFIKTLENEEQQEQCNQLNRRTEFIVLRTTYGLTQKK